MKRKLSAGVGWTLSIALQGFYTSMNLCGNVICTMFWEAIYLRRLISAFKRFDFIIVPDGAKCPK